VWLSRSEQDVNLVFELGRSSIDQCLPQRATSTNFVPLAWTFSAASGVTIAGGSSDRDCRR
jgi:hypothetical protein